MKAENCEVLPLQLHCYQGSVRRGTRVSQRRATSWPAVKKKGSIPPCTTPRQFFGDMLAATIARTRRDKNRQEAEQLRNVSLFSPDSCSMYGTTSWTQSQPANPDTRRSSRAGKVDEPDHAYLLSAIAASSRTVALPTASSTPGLHACAVSATSRSRKRFCFELRAVLWWWLLRV